MNVVHGKDIMKGDSKDSDAYATIVFPDGKKTNTETIDNTVNPLWKQLFTRELKLVKPGENEEVELKVAVYDADFALDPDDLLGRCTFDLRPTIMDKKSIPSPILPFITLNH